MGKPRRHLAPEAGDAPGALSLPSPGPQMKKTPQYCQVRQRQPSHFGCTVLFGRKQQPSIAERSIKAVCGPVLVFLVLIAERFLKVARPNLAEMRSQNE